ncbi:hypothetical protein HMPREF0005_05973, partial [Achromobacter xylosoxidans C54]
MHKVPATPFWVRGDRIESSHKCVKSETDSTYGSAAMAARVEILTRPRKLSIMGLLLAGTALGAAGCAQQRTEGYYDPPVESTVTDAQYQGSGAGYRTVLRAPSQVQIALKPDQKKTPSQAAAAAQGAATTEDGQAVPEG